jgi:predicted P-loop ATPase/GTPase
MDIKGKYYKLKLCDEYVKYGKCDKGDKCTYAHGKDEVKEIKKICNYGLNCFKESCVFEHPKSWNPKDNKKICNYGLNCFNDNCNFKHIDDFPDLNENIIINNVDVDTNKELLSNIEIIVNGIKYNDTDNMFNTSNFINNNIIEEVESIEDINTKVKKYVENNNNQIPELKEKGEIEEVIINLQKIFEKYTIEIKHNIDTVFINDKQKYGIDMKMELNKITSSISLFKHNYHDFIKYNNNR